MEEFIKKIKKYNLTDLISLGSNLLIELFNSDEPVFSFQIKNTIGLKDVVGNITVSPWDISDINYYSIINTHDFKYSAISKEDYISLVNDYLSYDEKRTGEKINIEKLNDITELVKLMWGLSRTQFWYQEKYKMRFDFNRQVELLELINTDEDFDLDNICQIQIGFTIKEIRTILLIIAAFVGNNINVDMIKISDDILEKYPFATMQNISKIIKTVTVDLEYIRKSPLKEQVFYIFPIVRNGIGKVISTNIYMIYKKIIDAPLWLIRDYFLLKEQSNRFLIYYGKLFEKYVEKIFILHLTDNQYERILENNTMQVADWIIHSLHYDIILEQKAYIPEIALLSRYPDITKIDDYLKKYEKAIIQLEKTQETLKTNKKIIKLLLHYDQLYIGDSLIKDYIIYKMNLKIENVYFIDIHSFERLIPILGKNELIFEKIIEEKIQNTEGLENTGFEFSQIIDKYYNNKNKYSKMQDHWDIYFNDYNKKYRESMKQ